MEPVQGLLDIKVVRGFHLAIADPLTHTSDPYVVLQIGSQKLKTSVVKKNSAPVWNEVLHFTITDATVPVKLEVFDDDKFTADDSMGKAEFDIVDVAHVAKMNLRNVPDGTVIKTIHPVKEINCLTTESHVAWKDQKVAQDLVLKLHNVETGVIELQLQWVHVPGTV